MPSCEATRLHRRLEGGDLPETFLLAGCFEGSTGGDMHVWEGMVAVGRQRGRPLQSLTKGGFLKNDMASRLAAYCGQLQNPQPQGGKPCFAKPVATSG
jgi:hypothetical protein